MYKCGPCKPCLNEKCSNFIFLNYVNGKRKYCQKCRAKRWSRKNRLRRFWLSLKGSAKKRDIQFSLMPYEAFRSWCYANSFKPKSYLPCKFRPSIDRIRENEGYSFDNIQKSTVSSNSIRHNEYQRQLAKERILQLSLERVLDDEPF